MTDLHQNYLSDKAVEVIANASTPFGISASADLTDNYGYVWARDSAVAGLAIIGNQVTSLYGPLKNSLQLLQKSASAYGQIPSNIQVNNAGEVIKVSFGGPAGRVDASFWWIVASVLYLQSNDDEAFKTLVKKQCEAIFNLANCWEFNGKGLMYVPMSSNWADEYITNGYVLYDQLLRYWALLAASAYFKRDDWSQKAQDIKLSIKQHYLFEGKLDDSLYTGAQQKQLKNFDLSQSFIASFSPGDRVEKFDGWSIALLLLLDIPSKASVQKINNAILHALIQTKQAGVPAFWPVIKEGEINYESLKLNYNFHFKNRPGHFHNGGIWPVVNGFLVAGLELAGQHETAYLLMDILHKKLNHSLSEHPFAEYFDFYFGAAGGVNNLCFSASGYLLASLAVNNIRTFKQNLLPCLHDKEQLYGQIMPLAEKIVEQIPLKRRGVTAIAVAGESGSGKTTLSKLFEEILTRNGNKVLVLHQDDYFKLPPQKNHNARVEDFSQIGPQEVRLDLLDQHIKQVKYGGDFNLSVPHMNWITDAEESMEIHVSGVNVILVDGTYTGYLENADYHIFINTNYKQTRKNRINRNRETVTPFIESVLKKESEIIQQQQDKMDIIVNSQFVTVKNNLK